MSEANIGVEMNCPFKVGDKVRHPHYKEEGTVVRTPTEYDSRLIISFCDRTGTEYYTQFISPESSGLYAKWSELKSVSIESKKDSVSICNALAFKIDDKVWHEEFGEGKVLGRVWSPSQDCWIAIDVKFGPHNSIHFYDYQPGEPRVRYIDELELVATYDFTKTSQVLPNEVDQKVDDMLRSKMSKQDVKKDAVNPGHYQQEGKQLWDIMQDLVSREEYLGYLKLNICKYLYRYKNKNGKEDLLKCHAYLQKLISTEYPE